MNVIAIDYGEKRVGIAKGDSEIKLALPENILDKSKEILMKSLDL